MEKAYRNNIQINYLLKYNKDDDVGTTQAQPPLSSTAPALANLLALPSSGQSSTIAAATCASESAVSQIPPPSTTVHSNTDPTVMDTDSSDSFINIDSLPAPATTRAPKHGMPSSNLALPPHELPTMSQRCKQSTKQLAPFLTYFKPNNYASNAEFKNKFNPPRCASLPWPNKCNN
uniref:Uncharacterized protein n=1 Tax=Romanomermis culicivorax TaxID=13658 RepID=A0A915KLM2_ROMCU